jgi:hypothetical protein
MADKALSRSPGFRGIEVAPELKDGHAMAKVTLLKDQEFAVFGVRKKC